VVHLSSIDGYKRFSLMRAPAVVNCQSTLTTAALRLPGKGLLQFDQAVVESLGCKSCTQF
jgi:hypothetical protein